MKAKLNKEHQDLLDEICADIDTHISTFRGPKLKRADFDNAINFLNNLFKSIENKTLKLKLSGVGFRQCRYVYNCMHLVSPFDPEKFIRIRTNLNIEIPGRKPMLVEWYDKNSVSMNTYAFSNDWTVRDILNIILVNKYSKTISALFADSLDALYKSKIEKPLAKYIKQVTQKEEKFNEGAEERALESLVRYVHDKKINFSPEEIKSLLPYLIHKRDELNKLVRWCTSNRKLSKKVNNEVLDKVEDNITILDILE